MHSLVGKVIVLRWNGDAVANDIAASSPPGTDRVRSAGIVIGCIGTTRNSRLVRCLSKSGSRQQGACHAQGYQRRNPVSPVPVPYAHRAPDLGPVDRSARRFPSAGITRFRSRGSPSGYRQPVSLPAGPLTGDGPRAVYRAVSSLARPAGSLSLRTAAATRQGRRSPPARALGPGPAADVPHRSAPGDLAAAGARRGREHAPGARVHACHYRT